MYDDREKPSEEDFHSIAILVYNEMGILARIMNMFLKRNFNIQTLSVGPSAEPNMSRMTISFYGDNNMLEQLSKQLNKLIDVVKIIDLPEDNSILSELALIKIHTKDMQDQNQVITYCKTFGARIASVTPTNMVVELVGKPQKINGFVDCVRQLGIKEIARTGLTAMATGKNKK